MKIGIIGTGYVGLPTGVGLAELGNQVVCIDREPKKIEALQEGKITLYEDGLEDRFKSNKLCVYGVDFGQTRNNTVIYVAEVGDEKEIQERTLNVKYKKEFDLGIEYGKIEDYIVEELPKRFPNLRRGIFDATGVGKSVYENVKRRVKKSPRPYPIEDFYFSEKTKKNK